MSEASFSRVPIIKAPLAAAAAAAREDEHLSAAGGSFSFDNEAFASG